MGLTLRALFFGITFLLLSILLFWYYEMQLHFGFKIAIGATLLLYLFVPILWHFSAEVQRHLVFLPFVRWPAGVDFNDPTSQGIPGGRNLYLHVDSDDSKPNNIVGVWHFVPKSLVEESKGKPQSFWDDSLRNSGKPILIYFHGNSGSRAGEHRKELYVIFQNMDYHVISFDYRGYADSAQIPPTETTCVQDGILIYNWVQSKVGNSSNIPIFIWGHSLGTGVSSHVVSNLSLAGNPPKALVLEAPFTSLGEEVKYHILSILWRILPFFDYIFIEPLRKNDIEFDSTKYIRNIDIPILILHAVDDPVIPFSLGEKLYNIGRETRSRTAKPIYFRGFGEGYAHKYICRSPELPVILEDFISCSTLDNWPCKSLLDPGEH